MARTQAVRTFLWLALSSACGGSPSEPAARPTTGSEYVAAAPAEEPPTDAQAADGEAERRRLAEIPSPKGEPPAWLSAAAPAYQKGMVLAFAPAVCDERVYLDAAGLVAGESALVRQLVDKLAAGAPRRVRNEYAAVMRIAKEERVDPVTGLREIAVCEGRGPDVIVVGIANDRPVEMPLLFQKVLAVLGKPPGRVERQGDISLLPNPDGEEAVAQLGPNVLVFGTRDAVLAAARAKAGAPGFADAAKHLVRAKTKDADVIVTEKGPNIDVTGVLHVRDGGAKRANELATRIQRDIQQAAERLATTELKVLGERLRATKVTARGGDVTIKGALPRAELGSLLKSAVSADLEQLMRSLKGR